MAADVLVLGAGIAGLAAAERLAAAGRRVLILEARDRLGGRIHTVDDPTLGHPIELGAEFVHGSAPELKQLAREAHIGIADIDGERWQSSHGRLRPAEDFWSKLDAVKMPAIAHAVYSRLVLPSFIVDVSEFVEKKMEAIRAYASQFYSPDSREPTTRISEQNFLRQMEDRTRYYGSLIGVAAGEPFYVREALNIEDPFALLTRPMNIYS